MLFRAPPPGGVGRRSSFVLSLRGDWSRRGVVLCVLRVTLAPPPQPEWESVLSPTGEKNTGTRGRRWRLVPVQGAVVGGGPETPAPSRAAQLITRGRRDPPLPGTQGTWELGRTPGRLFPGSLTPPPPPPAGKVSKAPGPETNRGVWGAGHGRRSRISRDSAAAVGLWGPPQPRTC